MAETWRGVGTHGDALHTLFIELGALNDVLDDFFLISPLLVVTPPHWSLVFALQTEMFAGAAGRLALVTLLAP